VVFFFLWYLFLFQRYSGFPFMQIWSLMTSSVGQVQWCDTKLWMSLPIMKQCFWNLTGMLHLTEFTRWCTFWCCCGDMLGSSLLLQNSIFVAARGRKIQLKMLKRRLNKGGLALCLRNDQVFCLVESQMVILNFEEAGDWNRAFCHSNIKMYTTCKFCKVHNWPNLHNRKAWMSLEQGGISQGENHHFALLWGAFWMGVFIKWLIFRVMCTWNKISKKLWYSWKEKLEKNLKKWH